jgi:hypothetical protein
MNQRISSDAIQMSLSYQLNPQVNAKEGDEKAVIDEELKKTGKFHCDNSN